ncbi:hypothetical protein F4678DRAFT_426507 [Xylaria arbuscula]|nr:hypothetical protein F4678DRAFT_426507 [Xylaria arbuscula]
MASFNGDIVEQQDELRHRGGCTCRSCEAAKKQKSKLPTRVVGAIQKLATKKPKDCPKCGRQTEKPIGGSGVRCIKCGHEFCWACTRPWRNHKHCGANRAKSGYCRFAQVLGGYALTPNLWNESWGLYQ